MSLVSVSEAARLVGKSRKTLYGTYIKTGKLSCVLSDSGEKKIDTTELLRVFGAFATNSEGKAETGGTVSSSVSESHGETAVDQTGIATRLAVLEAENAQLKERLADKDRHLEDMRQSVRLLEHKQARLSWWPWKKG